MALVWLRVVVAESVKVDDPVKRSETRYWMRDDPPLDDGIDHVRETWALPGVAERDWGGVEVDCARRGAGFRLDSEGDLAVRERRLRFA